MWIAAVSQKGVDAVVDTSSHGSLGTHLGRDVAALQADEQHRRRRLPVRRRGRLC